MAGRLACGEAISFVEREAGETFDMIPQIWFLPSHGGYVSARRWLERGMGGMGCLNKSDAISEVE